MVSTIAGSGKKYMEGIGEEAEFNRDDQRGSEKKLTNGDKVCLN
jgi:hypothetical protein